MGQGQVPASADRVIGETGGELVVMQPTEMPLHQHFIAVSTENGNQGSLTDAVVL
jgi:microcystin-dependent protein